MSGFPSGSHGTLVDVDWLAANLDGVVLLDASISRSVGPGGQSGFADGRGDFEGSHLPGARFADVFRAFSDPTADVVFTRPTAAQFVAAATAVGVHDDAQVVVYDRLSGAWAARIWWVFRSFGFADVRVLDGGMAAWTAAGNPLESGPSPEPPPGTVTVEEQDGWFVDLHEVRELSEDPDADRPVFCALRAAEFTAGGHIAGSSSLPYPDLLAPDGTVDIARAAEVSADISGSGPVLYCGGGINAAGLGLALVAVGREGLRVFDGSLTEWKAHGLPLVTS